jgi:hypothetical protein
MMKTIALCLLALASAAVLATHPLEGRWVGSIDTDRGQMQIALELKADGSRLTGAVKTPHGDWPVQSVTDAKGVYTVTFSTGDETGAMVGPVKDGMFSGKWTNGSVSTGTFTLSHKSVAGQS